jgi:hypothetical protein
MPVRCGNARLEKEDGDAELAEGHEDAEKN